MRKQIVDINKNWRPRGFQTSLIKDWYNAQVLALTCSRQVGKTTLGIQALLDFVFSFKKRKNPKALVVMKTADQAKSIYFERIDQLLRDLPETYYTKQGSTSSGLLVVTIKRPWLNDRVTIELAGAGNINALKGRTLDFLILDEMAFFPDEGCWSEVFAPMLDDTDGKAFITSTVEGQNHFYSLCYAFQDLESQGYTQKIYRTFDIYTSRVRHKAWIDQKEAEYKALKQWHLFQKEYLCDWLAAGLEEAPFMGLVASKFKEKQKASLYGNNGLLKVHNLYASMDMGKRGNNPVWVWVKYGSKVHILDYKDDDFNQYHLIDRLVEQYRGKYITIIYPNDALQPSINEGKTRIELIQQYIWKKGYRKIVNPTILDKTRNRKELLNDGMDLFTNLTYEKTDNVVVGLNKLAKARLKKDAKTGYISFGDFIKNGYQHAVDGFCYIAAFLNNFGSKQETINVAPQQLSRPIIGGTSISYSGFSSDKLEAENG